MITLSAFADEISPELDVQLDVLASEGISHLELRGVWGKNVLKLTDEQVAEVKATLDSRGFKVSSIGSPIGKIQATDPFEPHLADFRRALELARYFGSPYIRIFSFFIKEGSPEEHRQEVINRMTQLVHLAEEAGVTLLHENEKHIYGDTGERCRDLLQSCESPRLRAAFDPANYIQCKVLPMTEAYPLVESYISYVHIKDALLETGKVVPAGEGDGQFVQLLEALKARGYEGFMSLEPHLKAAETFQGFSGPDLFRVASQSLKKLLQDAGMDWN